MSEPTLSFPGPLPPTDLGQPPADGSADGPRVPGYELLDKLGEGGMGVVYRARQVAADRVVAIKAVKASRRSDAAALARFRTEARGVARTQHPNIIQIHEVGEADGLPYFTMEYCPGGGLDRRLADGPLPGRAAATMAEKLARAVQAAHDHNIIHRDLKPGNVLLAADGEPKVTDFGLAKQLDEDANATLGDAVLGTPSYMAPEQTLGKAGAAGQAADVWALGAILYESLTGRPPFKAVTAVDTMVLVREADPAAPSQLQPKVPRDLETICLKCLQKEPARRYASAAALAEDLRRFLAGEPILARPVGPAERLAKWARRRPAVAALLAGLAATLLAATAVSAGFAVEAGRQARDADDSAAETRAQEDVTRHETDVIREREAAADRAREAAEAATARGLERCLDARPEGPADDLAMDAMWDLAASRDDRVRLLFLDESLHTPEGARRLRNRAELALHAAVGLDPDRRRRVEEKLLAVLRDERADPEARAACVWAGAALGGCGPEFARESYRFSAEWFARQPPPVLRVQYAWGARWTIVSTRRLDHDGAADAARALADAMAHASGRFSEGQLTTELLDVLDRLPPEERTAPARAAARALADLMTRTAANGPDPPVNEFSPTLRMLAGDVAQVLGRLPAGEGTEPARDAVRALARADLSMALIYGGTGMGMLAPRLDAGAATEAASAVVKVLPVQAAKPNGSYQLKGVADDLTVLAPRLDADAAAEAARAVADVMSHESGDQQTPAALAPALEALAARMDADGAAALARSLADALPRAANANAQSGVAQALGVLLRRLPADQAAALASPAAHAVADALIQADPHPRSAAATAAPQSLGKGFTAVAPFLKADEAVTLARAFTEALPRTTNQGAIVGLAQALGAVADRLNSEDASAAAEALAVADSRSFAGYPLDRQQIPHTFEAACARLDPADAVYVVRALADAMERASPYGLPYSAAQAAAPPTAAAARLDPDGARGVADVLAASLTRAGSVLHVRSRALVLNAVLAVLPREEAVPRARTAAHALVDALRHAPAPYPGAYFQLAPELAAMLDRLPPQEAAPLARDGMLVLIDRLAPEQPNLVVGLNPGVSALAARLDRDGAAAAARRLAEAAAKGPAPDMAAAQGNLLASIADGLNSAAAAGFADPLDAALAAAPGTPAAQPLLDGMAAVAVRLDPRDIPPDVPRRLADALAGVTAWSQANERLARGLEVSAVQLGPDDACAAARRLTDAIAADREGQHLDLLARGLGAVLDRLAPDDADDVHKPARILTDVWKRRSDIGGRNNTYEYRPTAALLAVTTRPDAPQVVPARLWAAAAAPPTFAAFAVPALRPPPPSRLSMQDLVDLLKRPNCIGDTRGAVLQELSGLCGRSFDDVWDFVAWAEQDRPDLDLRSPSRRERP